MSLPVVSLALWLFAAGPPQAAPSGRELRYVVKRKLAGARG